MKIEIAIDGPWEAVAALHRNLAYGSERLEQGVEDDPKRARLILVEEEDRVNQILIRISHVAERELRIADELEFRVRNLAYSEPSSWCESLREPFQPVSSLTILPWHPTVSRPSDRHTIVLDSNLAFGTGRHPTTELCLKAIHDLSEVTEKLATYDEDALMRVAEELAATEEFELEQWDADEVQDFVMALAELAQIAESQGQTLFVWMHPLLT